MRRNTVTPETIAGARARLAQGERLCDVARDLGLPPRALGYHLRGGKARRYAGAPWHPHTTAAFRAIGAGNHAEAAYHLTAAAKALLNYDSTHS